MASETGSGQRSTGSDPSAVQAISVARRILDAAYASSAPGMMAVKLEWAKAFDEVCADSLIDGLRCFGLPGDVLDVISAICQDRRFCRKMLLENRQRRSSRVELHQVALNRPTFSF